MKKLILILSLLLCTWSVSVQASLKEQIHDYLITYAVLIAGIDQGPPLESSRMRVGDAKALVGDLAPLHMIEVMSLIVDGKLDECCFHKKPDVFAQYANATYDQLIDGATIYNPGTRGDFKIPDNLGKQFYSLFGQINLVTAGISPWTGDMDFYDNVAWGLMYELTTTVTPTSEESIFNNLIWGWSYIDPEHSSLKNSFKDYYIYACIVCDGAGFYNTNNLYDTNPKTGKLYYDEIVTPENLPKTWEWLQSKAAKQGQRPPLQPSIGLTFQGQAEETQRTLSDGVIYPTHCHQAKELYFGLDPMGLSKTAKSEILKGLEGYTYNTDSYGIGAINYLDLPIHFVTDLSSQFPQNFMTVSNGDILYNESLAYHAFNAGRRFQFTQWSRLTWPAEGTYFPLNGGPQPPPGVECAAKPSSR